MLRIVFLGFFLMVLLVIGAGYFGYRESVAIQESAQALVRARSLDDRDAELEQNIEDESEKLLTELSWSLGACLVFAVGGSLLTVLTIDRAFDQLEQQGEELNMVSWRLVDSHEKMARRFAHEMHDELGQSLTALKNMLQRSPDPNREEMIDVLNDVMQEMRELAQMLRPVILDDYGLDAALRWLRDRFVQRTQIQVDYDSNFSGRLAGPVETHLFRVVQEALTNVARHAQATAVSIRLDVANGEVRLTVEDNGVGLKGDAATVSGLGMVGMRARMRQLRGRLTTERRNGSGLRIRAVAPAVEASQNEEELDEWSD
ncbi:MAG: sensor histidine kinase [Bryobacterales bacterium]